MEMNMLAVSYPFALSVGAPFSSFNTSICLKLNLPIPLPVAFANASFVANLPARNSTFLCLFWSLFHTFFFFSFFILLMKCFFFFLFFFFFYFLFLHFLVLFT